MSLTWTAFVSYMDGLCFLPKLPLSLTWTAFVSYLNCLCLLHGLCFLPGLPLEATASASLGSSMAGLETTLPKIICNTNQIYNLLAIHNTVHRVHRQNVPRQNVARDKMSQDKTRSKTLGPRDKTSQETKRPKDKASHTNYQVYSRENWLSPVCNLSYLEG